MANIVLIQGHPDTASHLGHALEKAYAEGATEAGHEIRSIQVASLNFDTLRSREEWQNAAPADDIRQAQQAIAWADHIVLFYPLWLGSMPALVKAFLEQTLRPGFALDYSAGKNGFPRKLLSGKSARVVITMGMPALAYKWFYRAHSLKSLERNILRFCGIKPVHETLIGMVENVDEARRSQWIDQLKSLGSAGK
ncbi:NAD(P)H-dependent oxidoreductase [Proteobacteria bacterium 005FR1]|nr:NAD(P)H-dependent oxidoreductase [Proteobacteria bacterium 005FR1]